MAKARPCPICKNFFNPKFTGKEWNNTLVCISCFIYKTQESKRQHMERNALLTPNQG